jgi:hypothetical protein
MPGSHHSQESAMFISLSVVFDAQDALSVCLLERSK